ncbi:GIY-YIG nuclease family protein [Photobacterium swingsii]|uniref:GIY-YIG nuclease family protein n=1 Tax=Photobacterium swingsii TaxID=680026 RepID=UPI003D0F6E0B
MNKLEQEAKQAGLQIIGAGKTCETRTYKLPCGHDQELYTNAVRTNHFRCQTCVNHKLEQEAKQAGLQIIGKGKNHIYRLYKLPCGHEQELQLGHVRINNFKCHTCQRLKIEQEAKAVGLEIIGKGKNSSYRTYKLPCGHEQEIGVTAIRTNNFCCRECNESAWVRDSGLYAVVITDNNKRWIKVGVARDVNRRVKEYKLSKTASVDITKFIKIKDRITAIKVEKFIQSVKLKQYQLPPEEMKQYMKHGFTECFSIEALDLVEVMFDKIRLKMLEIKVH